MDNEQQIQKLYQTIANLHPDGDVSSTEIKVESNDILELAYSYRVGNSATSQLVIQYRFVKGKGGDGGDFSHKMKTSHIVDFAINIILKKHLIHIFSNKVKFTHFQFAHYKNLILENKPKKQLIAGVYGQYPNYPNEDKNFIFELRLKDKSPTDDTIWYRMLKVKGIPECFQDWDNPANFSQDVLTAIELFAGGFKNFKIDNQPVFCAGVNRGIKMEFDPDLKDKSPFVYSIIPQGFEYVKDINNKEG